MTTAQKLKAAVPGTAENRVKKTSQTTGAAGRDVKSQIPETTQHKETHTVGEPGSAATVTNSTTSGIDASGTANPTTGEQLCLRQMAYLRPESMSGHSIWLWIPEFTTKQYNLAASGVMAFTAVDTAVDTMQSDGASHWRTKQ